MASLADRGGVGGGSALISISTDRRQAGSGTALIAISTTTTVLALSMCGTRFMVRSRRGQSLRWDDYSIISAMLLGLVGASFAIVEGSSAKTTVIQSMKFNFLAQPWLLASSVLATVSICLSFIRKMGGRSKSWARILSGLIGAMIVASLMYIPLCHLQCRPLDMGWDDDVEGSCLNPAVEVNVGYLAGSINSFTFFLLAMFPLVLSRKVDTIRIFRLPFLMLSISTTVAGVLSIIKMYERSRNGIGRSYSSWSWTVTLLGVLVQNIAIVAANILPITQLLSRRPEHITLGSSSDTELHDRISTDNSSIMRVKRSATLTKRPSIRNRPSDRLNRKPSAQAHKGNENTEFGAVEVEAIRKPADALVASTGIMKTTTIHVVEVREGDEDGGRTPVRGHTKAKTSTSDGWKDVLSGSPP